jgi:hypothetical protein
VALPMSLHLNSAKNIFIYKIPDSLKVGGMIAIVYGDTNYGVFHIDPYRYST